MEIICAWCKQKIGEKPPYDDKRVTHTICPKCEREQYGDTGRPD